MFRTMMRFCASKESLLQRVSNPQPGNSKSGEITIRPCFGAKHRAFCFMNRVFSFMSDLSPAKTIQNI